MSLGREGAEGHSGPSARQPVAWIYQRAGLPLMVLAEQGEWRRVRDPDGTEVWMEAANLEARRTVYVRQNTVLRRAPRAGGQPLAILAPGVIGAVTGCDGVWRRVAVGGRIGWAEDAALWGGDCDGLETAIRP
ncbi:MAG: SH3 domain-containing protein [Hyphomonadaceae bacterium]